MMRYCLVIALCLTAAVSANSFSRHLNSDHVHDHDYPFQSRSANRENAAAAAQSALKLTSGPISTIADTQALFINYLENEIETISQEVDTLKKGDMDTKSALYYLRILKGNGCSAKQFQCLQKPNEVPECISHHAVCDGVRDCRTGNDESADRCRNLTPVGSSWGGDLQWIGCAAHRSTRMYVVVTSTSPHPYMASYLRVSATLVFTWVEDGKTFSNTEQADGHFCYGSRSLKLRATTGAHVGADLKCAFTGDSHCHGELFKATTSTVCSKVILNRQ